MFLIVIIRSNLIHLHGFHLLLLLLQLLEITSFIQNKHYASKAKFGRLVFVTKGFLNLLVLIKQKNQSLPRDMVFPNFGELLIVFLTMSIQLFLSSIPCQLCLVSEVLSFKSDKEKLFAEILFRTSNLVRAGISFPFFPFRTNLKLHNVPVTPKLIRKVITDLDSWQTSGRDCILVVVWNNYQSELSYKIAELLTMCFSIYYYYYYHYYYYYYY